jgi:phenylpropionate dioxygenase-like ring-hydroxylating dioxygenase large terminal subunit
MTFLFKRVFVGGPICGNDLEAGDEELPSTIDIQKNGRVHRYCIERINREPYFQFLHKGTIQQKGKDDENSDYSNDSQAIRVPASDPPKKRSKNRPKSKDN